VECPRLGLVLAGLAVAAFVGGATAGGDKKQADGDKKPVIITEKDKDAKVKATKGDTIW